MFKRNGASTTMRSFWTLFTSTVKPVDAATFDASAPSNIVVTSKVAPLTLTTKLLEAAQPVKPEAYRNRVLSATDSDSDHSQSTLSLPNETPEVSRLIKVQSYFFFLDAYPLGQYGQDEKAYETLRKLFLEMLFIGKVAQFLPDNTDISAVQAYTDAMQKYDAVAEKKQADFVSVAQTHLDIANACAQEGLSTFQGLRAYFLIRQYLKYIQCYVERKTSDKTTNKITLKNVREAYFTLNKACVLFEETYPTEIGVMYHLLCEAIDLRTTRLNAEKTWQSPITIELQKIEDACTQLQRTSVLCYQTIISFPARYPIPRLSMQKEFLFDLLYFVAPEAYLSVVHCPAQYERLQLATVFTEREPRQVFNANKETDRQRLIATTNIFVAKILAFTARDNIETAEYLIHKLDMDVARILIDADDTTDIQWIKRLSRATLEKMTCVSSEETWQKVEAKLIARNMIELQDEEDSVVENLQPQENDSDDKNTFVLSANNSAFFPVTDYDSECASLCAFSVNSVSTQNISRAH